MCRMARPLANRFCGQSRTRPCPERIWIRPCASVVIQIVLREGRPLLRPNVVRSTSGAVEAAVARSFSAVMAGQANVLGACGRGGQDPGRGRVEGLPAMMLADAE